MMLPTHIVMGGFIGLALSIIDPTTLSLYIYIGMIAGVIPDVDIFLEHRKTLHRPLEYLLVFTTLIFTYALFQLNSILVVAALFGSMSIHCISELFGQGKTMNPDLKTDDRCVYNHLAQNWLKPKRVVKVASIRDLMILMVFSIPLMFYASMPIFIVTISVLGSGVLMVLLNDWLTKNLLSDYDRFSEALQEYIGHGPEVAK